MTQATARLLVGRKIVAYDARPFVTGEGALRRTCHDPRITLDNGAVLTLTVEETEEGSGYGTKVNYHPPARQK